MDIETNTAGRLGELNVPIHSSDWLRVKNSPTAGRLFDPGHMVTKITPSPTRLGCEARSGGSKLLHEHG